MGHEIGPADGRPLSKKRQKQYGVATLLQILTGGNPGALAQLAGKLLGLSFTCSDDTHSDNRSVRYLCPTNFEADGEANFFQKIIDEESTSPPQFFSTHPSPDNRVENIQTGAAALSCGTEELDHIIKRMAYAQFQAIL
ncbi:MAG: putative Zn-dependent protease [Chitinophagales bacterium]|jgi:predicted Zn-dependent protease